MVRRKLLLALLFAAVFVFLSAAPVRANEVDWVGGQNEGDHTELGARDGVGAPGPNLADPVQPDELLEQVPLEPNEIDVITALDNGDCFPRRRGICVGEPTASPVPSVSGEPSVTLRDVVSFRPAPAVSGMEPNGWAVVGLPANFIAHARTEVVSGALLGRPAEVRFTPVGFRWEHSDGTVVTADGSGARRAELGLKEFSETSTSHRYAAPGRYRVTLVVAYGVEYRFDGSGWRGIPGTVQVPGQGREVLVGRFDTVLTTGDCTLTRPQPGC